MLTSRKPATSRKPSWASRGVDGATSPSTSTPRHHSTKNAHETRLIVSGAGTQPVAWETTSHTDPRSAPRSALNDQK